MHPARSSGGSRGAGGVAGSLLARYPFPFSDFAVKLLLPPRCKVGQADGNAMNATATVVPPEIKGDAIELHSCGRWMRRMIAPNGPGIEGQPEHRFKHPLPHEHR